LEHQLDGVAYHVDAAARIDRVEQLGQDRLFDGHWVVLLG
jgi:hypothetical protein